MALTLVVVVRTGGVEEGLLMNLFLVPVEGVCRCLMSVCRGLVGGDGPKVDQGARPRAVGRRSNLSLILGLRFAAIKTWRPGAVEFLDELGEAVPWYSGGASQHGWRSDAI